MAKWDLGIPFSFYSLTVDFGNPSPKVTRQEWGNLLINFRSLHLRAVVTRVVQ